MFMLHAIDKQVDVVFVLVSLFAIFIIVALLVTIINIDVVIQI